MITIQIQCKYNASTIYYALNRIALVPEWPFHWQELIFMVDQVRRLGHSHIILVFDQYVA